MDLDKIVEFCKGLHGWCPAGKMIRLAELARDANLCVEVGVFGGRSLIPMALGARGSCRVVGCDPYTSTDSCEGWPTDDANAVYWRQLDHDGIRCGAEDGISRAKASLRHGVDLELRICRGDELVGEIADGSSELVHVDGNHAEEVALADVKAWTPKVAPGGAFVLDDINWPSTLKAREWLKSADWFLAEDHELWGVYRRRSEI